MKTKTMGNDTIQITPKIIGVVGKLLIIEKI